MIKISKNFITIFFLILLFAIPVSAADYVVSWNESIDLARNNNNDLKSAIASEKATNYQSDAAFSGFLPQAEANFSSNRSKAGDADGNITENYNNSVSITQNLFSGFGDVGAVDRAKALNLVSQANLQLTKAQVSYDLKSAFANFIFAKETVNLLDDIIKRRDYNLEIIELRFKSGIENKGSLLLAKSYLEQAKYDRLQASNLIEVSRFALCKVLGITNCDVRDVAGAVPLTANSATEINFSAIVPTTPQYAQIVAQEKAAQAGITIAKSSFFPSVDLSLSNGQRGDSIYPENDYWSVGVNLSVPLFTGGRNYYNNKTAYYESAAAKENRETTEKQILVDLNQNYNSYSESITKLQVDEGFKKAAEMRADIARSRYNNGLLNFEDWDLVETDLINRQKTYLQSKRNRITSEAAWELIQGKGVFDE